MSDIRPGEQAIAPPDAADAGLVFIGRIRTPWRERGECPRRGTPDGPDCVLELDPRWQPALAGLQPGQRLQILYWMHLARRDLVLQTPRGREPTGTFALRSPVRPNPIASSFALLVAIEGARLTVRGLDCVDGTPLLDIKPEHGAAHG